MRYQEVLKQFRKRRKNLKDKREPPNSYKKSAFQQGWSGKGISKLNPNHLTWKSLGYHMGKHFGSQSRKKDIKYAYRILADEYSEKSGEITKYSKILNRLQELKEEKTADNREPPSKHKQSAFRDGWNEKRLDTVDLNNITWISLGYEMGKYFKTQKTKYINYAYRILADEYSDKS